MTIICPNCGFNPANEPYVMEATHCPKCGYIFGMSLQRMQELYNNMLYHISELVSDSDLVDTLHAIGFTDDEIIAEGFEIEEDDGLECPFGGDETDDCADCPYSGDYHFVNGECVARGYEDTVCDRGGDCRNDCKNCAGGIINHCVNGKCVEREEA